MDDSDMQRIKDQMRSLGMQRTVALEQEGYYRRHGDFANQLVAREVKEAIDEDLVALAQKLDALIAEDAA